MSSLFSDPPTPPNPMATAAAQTGTNVSTAIANSYLGMINQTTPQGSLKHDVTGTYPLTDPTTGLTHDIPRWTSTQSQFNPTEYLNLNPDVMAAARSSGQPLDQFAQQHYQTWGQYEPRSYGTLMDTQNQSNAAKLNMSQIANMQSGAIENLFGTPFNAASSAPQSGDINLFNQVGTPQSGFADAGPLQDTYASGGNIQRGFDSAGDVTRTYGPQDNYGADRQRIEAGLMERMNPQLQIEQDRLRNQLANQGIAYGSSAYTNAMDNYNRMANDARLGVIGVGGQEQQRMDQMAAQRAGFQNAAQQQAYAQLLGRGQFANQAQQQAEQQNAARAAFGNQAEETRFNQLMGRANFYNQSQNQLLGRQSALFNAQNQNRNQYLQERYQERNQPINEITALLSGSQVSAPNFINAQRTTIPTTDVAGLINQNFAQQNDLYKTNQSFWGDIIGGGLGAAGRVGSGILSDVRAKENIQPLGSVFSSKGELPIYSFDYKNDDPDNRRHVGPMAQDVERLEPRAVKEIGGRKHILPDKLGSIFGRAA